jgi:hypothetical protein
MYYIALPQILAHMNLTLAEIKNLLLRRIFVCNDDSLGEDIALGYKQL